MQVNADLHIHTKESDGSLTVEEVLKIASEKGLNIISITDHETTLGSDKARQIASTYDIEIISGVEFSTYYLGEEIHLLGYYKNTNNDQLQEKLRQIRKERTAITRQMVEKLRLNGLQIDWEQVVCSASLEGTISKAHIIYAMENQTQIAGDLDFQLAASWFKPGGIAYIPYEGNPYQQAVDFILQTGGLPVLAHPGLIHNQSLILDLLSYKPIGLEVYYGYWERQEERINRYKGISEEKAILSTGGSDYHGYYSPIEIGEIKMPQESIADIKKFLQISN